MSNRNKILRYQIKPFIDATLWQRQSQTCVLSKLVNGVNTKTHKHLYSTCFFLNFAISTIFKCWGNILYNLKLNSNYILWALHWLILRSPLSLVLSLCTKLFVGIIIEFDFKNSLKSKRIWFFINNGLQCHQELTQKIIITALFSKAYTSLHYYRPLPQTQIAYFKLFRKWSE